MPTFLTVVDVNLTVPASEAVHTVTLVVVLLVDAGRSILTGGTEANNRSLHNLHLSSFLTKYKLGGQIL